MKCIWLDATGKLAIADRALPAPQDGWDILKVRYAGICKTDALLAAEGKAGNVILGHELVLEKDGRHYVLNNEISCGHCYQCRHHHFSHCENMQELGVTHDGGFAEYIAVPREYLFEITDELGIAAVFVEPLACTWHALDKIQRLFQPEDACDVLMLGAGVSSRLLAMVLRSHFPNFRLYFYDKSEQATFWCHEFGQVITDSENFPSVDMVCELVGAPEQTLRQPEQYLRPQGVVLLYGVPWGSASFGSQVTPRKVFDFEWTVLATKAGCDAHTIGSAIHFIRAHRAYFLTMIGKELSLNQAVPEILNFTPLPGTRSVVVM